jgi:hypothetical protein
MIYNELFFINIKDILKLKIFFEKQVLFLVIFCSTSFYSCKKKDQVNPVVKINSPLSGQHFTVEDTIAVSATISDDEEITSVHVRLLNSAYASVGNDLIIPVSSNSYSLNVPYIIDNLFLETGNYLIAVIASDGHSETNAYVNIIVNELPKERKGIYLFSSSDSSSFKISRLDSANNPVNLINVSGDYSGSAIYSSNHELFTLGKLTGALNAFNLDNNSLLWSKPVISPLAGYQDLFFSNDRVYVSYLDGNIRGYDKNGALKYSVQQQGFFIPGIMYKNDQFLFAEIYYPSTSLKKIGGFYLVTGIASQEKTIDIDLKNMYSLDANRLLLFGNDLTSGQGQIEIYNISGNGTNSLHSIPTGSLNDVVQVDNNHYFISHSDGIYLYDYSLNSLTPFTTGFSVYLLEYDDVNQQLFACSGNQVRVYDSVNGSFQFILTSVDTVLDVRILYNK